MSFLWLVWVSNIYWAATLSSETVGGCTILYFLERTIFCDMRSRRVAMRHISGLGYPLVHIYITVRGHKKSDNFIIKLIEP